MRYRFASIFQNLVECTVKVPFLFVILPILHVVNVAYQPVKDLDITRDRNVQSLSFSITLQILLKVFHEIEEHNSLALDIFF